MSSIGRFSVAGAVMPFFSSRIVFSTQRREALYRIESTTTMLCEKIEIYYYSSFTDLKP